MTDGRGGEMVLRVAGAVGLVVAAVIHVLVAIAFGGVPGVLFVLSALGMLAGGALLFRSPRLGWIIGGGVAGLTALGYILRSTVGLPPVFPNAMSFTRPTSGAVSAIVEILVVLLAVFALSRAGSRTPDASASHRSRV